MKYYFIINGRQDKSGLKEEVLRQLEEVDILYDIYTTTGAGDAARFVNIFCDLNPKEEVCFVSVGGSGMANEVASGVIKNENKYLAILNISGSCDLTKTFPDRNFKSVKEIVNGESKKIDVLKINNNYSINVAHVGMDAIAAYYADLNSKENIKNPYRTGLLKAFLFHRFNRFDIKIDGKPTSTGRYHLLASIANGCYYGGEYLCAPKAVTDDGFMDVCIIQPLSFYGIARILPKYLKGTYMEDNFCRKRLHYTKAKSIDISSRDLITLCYDGEIIASAHFHIEIMEKAMNLILPPKVEKI